MTLWLLVHVAVPTAHKHASTASRQSPLTLAPLPPWPRAFLGIAAYPALVSGSGTSSGFGGGKEQRLALANPCKEWAACVGEGPVWDQRALGALHPGAPCHASALLCQSALLPETGVLLSYQSPEGIWVAQPRAAFSARATQGLQARVSARCLSSCPPHRQSVRTELVT